jgi:hypothetical protein
LRIEQVLGLLGACDRKVVSVEQTGLHQQRRVVPVDVLVSHLAACHQEGAGLGREVPSRGYLLSITCFAGKATHGASVAAMVGPAVGD